MTKSILICGVGGQGILLASDILALTALKSGFDVKKSEVHGMAQRGGAVTSAVRFGAKVYSPLISENEADIILAFEKLEALRTIKHLKQGGIYIINNYELPPLCVSAGEIEYPTNIIPQLKKVAKEVILVDGLSLARQAGNPRTVNIVLLGALAQKLNFPKEKYFQVIEQRLPEKTWKVNKKAFLLGFSI
ncbi:indolepyruvate oxidoreductase subunit beta [candidate division WOR-3 bacterium]|nr:indolepyruvate oxidoreductase subunit beta [candidate division WOR-3 bacterium]